MSRGRVSHLAESGQAQSIGSAGASPSQGLQRSYSPDYPAGNYQTYAVESGLFSSFPQAKNRPIQLRTSRASRSLARGKCGLWCATDSRTELPGNERLTICQSTPRCRRFDRTTTFQGDFQLSPLAGALCFVWMWCPPAQGSFLMRSVSPRSSQKDARTVATKCCSGLSAE